MPRPQPSIGGSQRFLGAVFGFVFGGVGLTLIFHLWTESGFGEPPLFFKIFGSFISLAFVAMGGTLFLSAFKGTPAESGTDSAPSPVAPGVGYTCPACGARLGEDADVSPKGDVKCGYCRKWFNIHG